MNTGQTVPQGLGTPASNSPNSNESGYSSLTPSPQLQQMIDKALRNEPTLARDSLSANVSDTAIDLKGTVGSGKEKQTALRIARSYARNRKVIDHITVAGGTNGMDHVNSGKPAPQP